MLYIIIETKEIAEYTNKKEALIDLENNKIWYPQSRYELKEVDL